MAREQRLTYQFGMNGMIGASGTFTNLHFLKSTENLGIYDSKSGGGSRVLQPPVVKKALRRWQLPTFRNDRLPHKCKEHNSIRHFLPFLHDLPEAYIFVLLFWWPAALLNLSVPLPRIRLMVTYAGRKHGLARSSYKPCWPISHAWLAGAGAWWELLNRFLLVHLDDGYLLATGARGSSELI